MKKNRSLSIVLLVIGLVGVSGRALASPLLGGHGHGGSMMGAGSEPGMLFPMMLRTLELTPAQRGQVAEIMARHRTSMEPLFQQVRAAHDELATKLFAPGTVSAADLAPGLARLAVLKQQLLQDWTQAALETRAVLTPEQLAKAAQVKQRLDALHAEIDGLLGSPPASPEE